jgi:hypothetical protein
MIAFLGLATYLATVYKFHLVMRARTPRTPDNASSRRERGRGEGMIDPTLGTAIELSGSADGQTGGDGGCSHHVPDMGGGGWTDHGHVTDMGHVGHVGHFFGHM